MVLDTNSGITYIYVEWYKWHECMDIWMYEIVNVNLWKVDMSD